MYWNEIAWKAPQDDFYRINDSMREFLRVYAELAEKFRIDGIYVPQGSNRNLSLYPIEKWMHKADKDDCRRFLQFWQKRKEYTPEEECEFRYLDSTLHAGTEAILNDSFMISIALCEEWKKNRVSGRFYTLITDIEKEAEVVNIYQYSQLYENRVYEILQRQSKIKVYSYQELWEKKERYFPHLKFCPSVEKNFKLMETFYIDQVVRKLLELENYCAEYKNGPFDAGKLSKTTQESEVTLRQYRKEHTFLDENGNPYLASWHMRFTGIPGRIFFVPDYKDGYILICYIGSKLPNVNYPT